MKEHTNCARILIAESGSGYGGSAKYLASLLPLLDRNQFSVEVVAYGSGPFIKEIEKQGALLHCRSSWRFPWGEECRGGVTPPSTSGMAGRGNSAPTASLVSNFISYALYLFFVILQITLLVPAIAFWLRRRKIRLVHLNNEILSHLPLVLASRLAGCRIFCHLHGWRWFTSTERWASRFTHQFAAVTQSGADFYSWQLKGRNVIGIPNGLMTEDRPTQDGRAREEFRKKLGISQGEFLAVMVGRLIPLKGHSVFFRALVQAKESVPNLHGLVVGNDPSPNGQYLKQLQLELHELGLEHNVQFSSWQDHMGPVYQASDVVVQPSVEPESFGYVALEAMSWAKPVIASRLGGFQDVVRDGKTGFLVEAGNSNELAHAIVKIAKNPDLTTRFGMNGKQRAQTFFSMTQNAEQVRQVYEKLLRTNENVIPASTGMTRVLFRLLKQAAFGSGAVQVIKHSLGSKVPILMYHRVLESPDPFFPSVSVQTFRKQMEYIKRAYTIISLDELVDWLLVNKKIPSGSLVITFDDLDAKTWSVISPVLNTFKIPVTVFLASGPADEKVIWTDRLRFLLKNTDVGRCEVEMNGFKGEWRFESAQDRVRALHELGPALKVFGNDHRKAALNQIEDQLGGHLLEMPNNWSLTKNQIKTMRSEYVKFGAHTVMHPILSRMTVQEARYEIYESKKQLESIVGERVRHFAYPNGEERDFTAKHEQLVHQGGFDSACTAILGLSMQTSNRYALRRVYAAQEPLAAFASRLVGLGS